MKDMKGGEHQKGARKKCFQRFRGAQEAISQNDAFKFDLLEKNAGIPKQKSQNSPLDDSRSRKVVM